MYVYMYLSIYIYIHLSIYVQMYVCMYVSIYLCTNISITTVSMCTAVLGTSSYRGPVVISTIVASLRASGLLPRIPLRSGVYSPFLSSALLSSLLYTNLLLYCSTALLLYFPLLSSL